MRPGRRRGRALCRRARGAGGAGWRPGPPRWPRCSVAVPPSRGPRAERGGGRTLTIFSRHRGESDGSGAQALPEGETRRAVGAPPARSVRGRREASGGPGRRGRERSGTGRYSSPRGAAAVSGSAIASLFIDACGIGGIRPWKFIR